MNTAIFQEQKSVRIKIVWDSSNLESLASRDQANKRGIEYQYLIQWEIIRIPYADWSYETSVKHDSTQFSKRAEIRKKTEHRSEARFGQGCGS